MLKQLVNDYMKGQWVNNRRDIGFHSAKEELLGNGTLMFFEPGTTTPKNVYSDVHLDIPMPNPVVADCSGDFEKLYLAGDYSITASKMNGEYIAMITTNPDFNIES